MLGPPGEGALSGVLVVGFGSTLMADDGAGPAVVESLRRATQPGLRAEDGGQDSLRLPSLWRGEPEVWLVDALVRGAPPGTLHVVPHEQLLEIPQRHGTAHQLSLPESLRWLALAWPELASVRYTLFGIEPERLELVQGLSPAVAAAVERLARELGARAAALHSSPTRPALPTRLT